MKRIFLFVLLTFNSWLILNCQAELFDGSVHYYIKAGENLTADTKIEILYFDYYEEKIKVLHPTKHTAGQKLQTDRNYYYNQIKRSSTSYYSGKYQPTLSTSSRDVDGKRSTTQVPYTGPWYPGAPVYASVQNNYYIYYGFAKDKSSYIYWHEDLDGNILKKIYYTEISIDDILPKAVNRDFLYE